MTAPKARWFSRGRPAVSASKGRPHWLTRIAAFEASRIRVLQPHCELGRIAAPLLAFFPVEIINWVFIVGRWGMDETVGYPNEGSNLANSTIARRARRSFDR